MDETHLTRRSFIKLSLTASALLVGGRLGFVSSADANETLQDFSPNAWIRIDRNNSITLIIDKSEMGQGIMTGLAMLLAEELEVEMSQVRTEFAPADPIYANSLFGVQATGGSTGIPSSWDNLRSMGAAARSLFIQAAAKHWQVAPETCSAKQGRVLHLQTGRHLSYGDLIDAAARESVPDEIKLKSPQQFHLIGKPVARLDTPAKIDGSALFGIDVQLDGLVNASIKHPPEFGAKLINYDDSASRTVPGVIDIFSIDSGVVVVAETFWHAKKAADLLRIKWSIPGEREQIDSEAIRRRWIELAREDGSMLRDDGDADKAVQQGNAGLTAVYELPYQAHATMEPMNCTVDLKPGRCDVWVGTQGQGVTHEAVVALTGLDYEQVHIHITYLGGGFGRRGEVDFVIEAVQVARHVRRPVKLIWTREEDMQHDFYRPASYHAMNGAVKDGKASAWKHRIIGSSIMQRVAPDFAPAVMPRWVPRGFKDFAAWMAEGVMGWIDDATLSEGASNHPYAIPNVEVDAVSYDPGVPIGFWRAVGHSANAFVVESFIDELAHQAQADPYLFRKQLLPGHPRHLGVLDLAAEKAGWGRSLPPGRGMGIAVHHSFESYAAQVAEVEVDGNGHVRVTRVVCAIDCGIAVNPNTITAQVESAIAYGLSAALKDEITLQDGRVQQSNFHDFPILRMHEMPKVEVHIVASEESPTGVGEPGLPVIAPAVANAIFVASGKRIRQLPLKNSTLQPG